MTAAPPPPTRPLDRLPLAERHAAFGWLGAACGAWLRGDRAPATPAGVSSEALGRLAHCHQVEGVLHALAAAGRLPGAAQPLAERWEAAYYQNHAWNQGLLDLAVELVDRARRAGLRLRVLKGLATVGLSYGDCGLRPMADLDLLCRRRDLAELCRLAARLGFASGERNAVFHLALRHAAEGWMVELHTDVYDVVARRAAFVERLWREPGEVVVACRRLPAPNPEPHALLLLAHLIQHDLRLPLRCFLDLACALGGRRTAADPRRLGELLEAHDLAAERRVAERLLEDLFAGASGDRTPAAAEPGPAEADGAEPATAALRRSLRAWALAADRRVREPRLGEAAARPWRQRPGYLLRLLLPPRAELAALRQIDPSAPAASYFGHWRASWLRARGKPGGGGPPAPSLKRRVYARRGGG